MLKYSLYTLVAFATFWSITAVSSAGEIFFQCRTARSKHCLPAYDYRTSHSEATTAVISAAAIPLMDTLPASNSVVEYSRQFVLPDAQSGPILLSGLSAKTFPKRGLLLVTGVLTHSGGPNGQQMGGKAVIRVDALGGVGTAVTNLTVMASREVSYWVRQDEPETIQIGLECNQILLAEIKQLGHIRVNLEYHPNR